MTGKAVAQGVGNEMTGTHETLKGENFRLTLPEANAIIEKWPAPAKGDRRADDREVRPAKRGHADEALLV